MGDSHELDRGQSIEENTAQYRQHSAVLSRTHTHEYPHPHPQSATHRSSESPEQSISPRNSPYVQAVSAEYKVEHILFICLLRPDGKQKGGCEVRRAV
jgi:hypothetical protein